MVEPPTTFGARGVARLSLRLRVVSLRPLRCLLGDLVSALVLSHAFSSASHSTPLCSVKPLSSAAMTARLRLAEIAG
jgi:hypothetical protein